MLIFGPVGGVVGAVVEFSFYGGDGAVGSLEEPVGLGQLVDQVGFGGVLRTVSAEPGGF